MSLFISGSVSSSLSCSISAIKINGTNGTQAGGDPLPLVNNEVGLYSWPYSSSISASLCVTLSGSVGQVLHFSGSGINFSSSITSSVSQTICSSGSFASGSTTFVYFTTTGSSSTGSTSGSVTVHNAISTANITGVTGIAGFSFTTITGVGTETGYHSGFTGGITVKTSGTIPTMPSGAFFCTLTVNTVPKQTLPATSGATYNFTSSTYAIGDSIRIDLAT